MKRTGCYMQIALPVLLAAELEWCSPAQKGTNWNMLCVLALALQIMRLNIKPLLQ
ncbi:UNVERIFIED_CONTAM: hypothetical protein Sindi_0963900, partial [Sesamum indicum]